MCPVIDRTDPLADAAAAHRHSQTGHARGKLVLVVDEQLAHLRREVEAVQVFASASIELAGAGEPRDAGPVASKRV